MDRRPSPRCFQVYRPANAERLEERCMLTAEFVIGGPVEVIATHENDELVDFAMADFDGDSHLDVIVARNVFVNLDVALGTGQGGFGEPYELPFLRGVFFLSAADLDGDGWQDLLVGRRRGETDIELSWARNLRDEGDNWLGLDIPIRLTTLERSLQLAVADFDRNGHLDLAIADGVGLAVHLGIGDGNFDDPVSYASDGGVYSVMATDFDLDGHLDLAAVNANTAELSLLMNSGDGTFEADDHYSLGTGGNSDGATPWPITSGDIDQDGDLDLIVGQNYSHGENIAILLGDGDGAFLEEPVRDMVPGAPSGVTTGDVDADGDLDVVVAHSGALHHPVYDNTSPGFSILLGQGTPFLGKPLTLVSLNSPGRVQIANVDGDEKPEIVTRLPRGVGYFLNRDDQTFDRGHESIAAGLGPTSVVVGDVNNDRNKDFLITNRQSHDITVKIGDRDSPFQQATQLDVGDRPMAQAVGDINGDGLPDLVTANSQSNDVSVLLSAGGGAYLPESRLEVGQFPNAIELADLNRDGLLDLAVLNIQSSDVSILLGSSKGEFAAQRRFRTAAHPNSIVVMDGDDDDRLDLFVATSTSLSVMRGLGDGTFTEESRLSTDGYVERHVIADFNGDRRDDFVLVSRSRNGGFSNGSQLSVILSDGNGAFREPIKFPVDGYVNSLNVLDANRDGHSDLAVAASADNTAITILLGDGQGQFAPQSSTPGGPYFVHADWNDDGLLDLAYVYDRRLRVRLGEGDGTFGLAQRIATAEFAQMEAGDFNGDGHLDLFGRSEGGSRRLAIVPGNGDGTFERISYLPRVDSARFGVTAFTSGDWDGDGDIDLAIAFGERGVAVLLNQGDGSYEEVSDFANLEQVNGIVSADWDGDGKLDLAASSPLDRVHLFFGSGDGSFDFRATMLAGDSIASMKTGDLDGDGNIDLSLVNSRSGDLTTLWGHGDGTFDTPDRIDAGLRPTSLQATDLNGDDRTDLVSLDNERGQVVSLINKAAMSFDPLAQRIRGGEERSVLADMNADGVPDLVTTSSHPATVGVYLGIGDGTFGQPDIYSDGQNFLTGLRVDDFNGDDVPDVATSSDAGVFLYLGAGGGKLEKATRYAAGNGARALDSADFDDDGNIDLSFVNEHGKSASILLGLGDGSFSTDRLASGGLGPQDIELADLNNDSYPDVVVLNQESNSVSVLLGEGDGEFDTPEDYRVGRYPMDMTLVDIDGDSFLDVIAIDGEREVSLLLGNGNGTFKPRIRERVSDHVQSVISDDLNGDGAPELILTTGDRVVIYEVNADATLGDRKRIRLEGASKTVTHDFNRDGHVDLAVLASYPQRLEILLGDGELGFESVDRHPLIGQPANSIVSVDVNMDGLMDVVTGSHSVRPYCFVSSACAGASFAVMYGRGDGTFEAGPNYILDTSMVSSLAATDLDQDTDPDLVVLTPEGAQIFLNQTRQPSDRLAGDVNDDGLFNSSDLVAVFRAGEYEDALPMNSTFVEGDWNDDGEFNSSDLVLAFRLGHYSAALRPVDLSVLAIDWLFAGDEAAEREPIKKAAVDSEPIAELRPQ